MYINKRKSASTKDKAIFVDDGNRRVCAGYFDNGVFSKRVRNKHILQKPVRAIAIQAHILELLIANGCHTIIAELVEQDKRLKASVNDFLKQGATINRGFGIQIALPLSKWVDLNALQQQPSLFEADD